MQFARLPHDKPTATVFEAPIERVHAGTAEALQVHAAPDAVFGERKNHSAHADVQFADYFAVEDAHDPAFGTEILSETGNQNDFYVHTYGVPLWPSPVYRGARGGLPFIAAFHVHLARRAENRTLVSIRAIDAQIVNGMQWGVGSCGPGYALRFERVAPTTVEEYALLRYIGRNLAAAGVPQASRPPSEP